MRANRKVFSFFLNDVRLLAFKSRSLAGSLFQAYGLENAKARGPNVLVLQAGIDSSQEDAVFWQPSCLHGSISKVIQPSRSKTFSINKYSHSTTNFTFLIFSMYCKSVH